MVTQMEDYNEQGPTRYWNRIIMDKKQRGIIYGAKINGMSSQVMLNGWGTAVGFELGRHEGDLVLRNESTPRLLLMLNPCNSNG